MATVGAKNQPIVQTTDTFNPVGDINVLSNWVANNYANFKVLTGATTKSSLTGADLFVGLVVWEQSSGQFWQYNGSAWSLLGIGTTPRIELTSTATQSAYFTSGSSRNLINWTTTENRGGFSVASGVVTIPFTGRYDVYGGFAYAAQATATGSRIFRVITGTGVTYQNVTAPVNTTTASGSISINGLVLTAGDTLVLQGFQTSGVASDWISSSTNPSKFIIEYVGA
jgi:hypothetical protein